MSDTSGPKFLKSYIYDTDTSIYDTNYVTIILNIFQNFLLNLITKQCKMIHNILKLSLANYITNSSRSINIRSAKLKLVRNVYLHLCIVDLSDVCV